MTLRNKTNSPIHQRRKPKTAAKVKVTDKEIAEALKAGGGNHNAAKQYLEDKYGIVIDRSTISHRLGKTPELREICDEENKITTDIAVYTVVKKVKQEDYKASIWWLEHSKEGKRRGFGNRIETELSNPEGQAFKIETERHLDLSQFTDEEINNMIIAEYERDRKDAKGSRG